MIGPTQFSYYIDMVEDLKFYMAAFHPTPPPPTGYFPPNIHFDNVENNFMFM